MTTLRGFHAQRFYLNLLPDFFFLHHPTDLDAADKPLTSVFLILQHGKSYKPSKNGAICASAYLLCAQRFYHSPLFNRTFVQMLIAPCIAAGSGTKVLCANFVANSVFEIRCFNAQRFFSRCSRSQGSISNMGPIYTVPCLMCTKVLSIHFCQNCPTVFPQIKAGP